MQQNRQLVIPNDYRMAVTWTTSQLASIEAESYKTFTMTSGNTYLVTVENEFVWIDKILN